jgi:GAF domain-containing protein
VVDCFDALTSDRPYRKRMTDEDAMAILAERSGKMYDPHVVDTFMRVYRDIAVEHDDPGPVAVMQRITQSRHEPPAPVDAGPEPPAMPSSLLAFVSLSRLTSGEGSLADVPAAHTLRGMHVGTGERLTGWVAAQRQPIVNSDAALDLGPKASEMTPPLESCMSVPLMVGDALVAILSLYAPGTHAFDEDRGRLIQMVAPHLASAIQVASLASPAAAPDLRPAGDAKPATPLRLVVGR